MPRYDTCLPNAAADVSRWSDARLLADVCAVERDPAALETLVRRHTRTLERRCIVITGDRDRAADLAQETWSRMLRARATLRADGSFGAYLAKIALNLWRDQRRAERYALELSERRSLSLDASARENEFPSIGDAVAGPTSSEEAMLLRLDLRDALARLPARLRAVVIARHVRGESAAQIGQRYGRTEQTITAWLREATARMQHDLRDWRSAA